MASDNKYDAIVVGTSAGGLAALSILLEGLPSGYQVPVIIVQHRSKEPGGLLEELLQAKCRVMVKQADEKEIIKQGHVYIAPPDYHLMIEKDHSFSLTADEPVSFSRPSIDVLFESAAGVYKNRLVGIVLTGSNSDGAFGIRAIADHNGVTIAQSPGEAQFPAMPLAAISTNRVRHVLTLLEIQAFLLKTSIQTT